MTAAPDIDLLSRLQPLAALPLDARRQLSAVAQRHAFPRGTNPLHAHDWHGQVVYLVRGQLRVDVADGGVRVLVGALDQGAHPLWHGERRPLAMRAITDIELLSLAEDTLDILLVWHQMSQAVPVQGSAEEVTDWRQMSGMFAAENLTQGAFASLPPANIQSLLGRFVRQTATRGETIIAQGDPGDFYYLIESGRCKVSRLVAGAEVQIAELKAGQVFGEEALVADTVRNATVTMKTDGVLLRLAKRDFDELLRAPLLQAVSAEEAVRRVAAGAVWLDVRFPAEYQQDGLPGAINIPLNELRPAAESLDAGKEYIAYCQSGRRSSAAAFLLSQRGLRATLLDGGLAAHPELMEKKK